jgi:hypothetical protein
MRFPPVRRVQVKRGFSVAMGWFARLTWHSRGPRRGAMRGGAVGSPKWTRRSRIHSAAAMSMPIASTASRLRVTPLCMFLPEPGASPSCRAQA